RFPIGTASFTTHKEYSASRNSAFPELESLYMGSWEEWSRVRKRPHDISLPSEPGVRVASHPAQANTDASLPGDVLMPFHESVDGKLGVPSVGCYGHSFLCGNVAPDDGDVTPHH